MILAPTPLFAMLLMVLGILCWGSWATTFKFSGKWRFELYYFDFAFGLVAAAVLIAFTFGNLGFDGFSVVDDLLHAGKRQWFFGFLTGVLFNFGNMLLLAAVSVTGLSVAFPLGVGTALIAGTVLQFLLHPAGDSTVLYVGFAFGILALGFVASAYGQAIRQRHEILARRGQARSTRRPSAAKGIVLPLVAGLLMGASIPIVDSCSEGDLGLGPYAIAMLLSFGILASTFVFNLFLMNLPVEGEPVDIFEYFSGTLRQHLWGVAGGIVWTLGTVAILVAIASVPDRSRATSPEGFPLAQASLVVAGIWGLVKWKEFRDARTATQAMLIVSLVLFSCAIALIVMGTANQKLF
jgi:glucose uptake protein